MSEDSTQTLNPAMTDAAYATAMGETFQLGGRTLRRLAEFEFAAVDNDKGLDFHIIVLDEMKDEEGFQHHVEIDIYDNHNFSRKMAYVDTAYAVNLEEAVLVAFGYFSSYEHGNCDLALSFDGDRAAEDREGAPASPHASDEVVNHLLKAAELLEAEPRADEPSVFFPNWDGDVSEDPDERIRQAATAVLAGRNLEDERVALILDGARTVLAKYDPAGDGGGHTSKKALAELLRYIAYTLKDE